MGLETLAATINEESVTLEDVYEPYLMHAGFLTRTPPWPAASHPPRPISIWACPFPAERGGAGPAEFLMVRKLVS